jgi:hypothetical protein
VIWILEKYLSKNLRVNANRGRRLAELVYVVHRHNAAVKLRETHSPEALRRLARRSGTSTRTEGFQSSDPEQSGVEA